MPSAGLHMSLGCGEDSVVAFTGASISTPNVENAEIYSVHRS